MAAAAEAADAMAEAGGQTSHQYRGFRLYGCVTRQNSGVVWDKSGYFGLIKKNIYIKVGGYFGFIFFNDKGG